MLEALSVGVNPDLLPDLQRLPDIPPADALDAKVLELHLIMMLMMMVMMMIMMMMVMLMVKMMITLMMVPRC